MSAAKRRRTEPEQESVGAKLWRERRFPDAEVKCADKVFLVHRGVLAQASDVFARMFDSSMVEGQSRKCEINDADPEAVEAMLKYMYTNEAAIFGACGCSWSQSLKGRRAKISNGGSVVRRHNDRTEVDGAIAVAMHPASQFTVRVTHTSDRFPRGGLGVGFISTYKVKLPSNLDECCAGFWGISGEGCVCQDGKSTNEDSADWVDASADLKVGDVVTCKLSSAGKFTVTVNDQCIVEHSFSAAPLQWYPVVDVYGCTTGVEVVQSTEIKGICPTKVLPLAARFELRELVTKCGDALLQGLSTDNIVERIRVLEMHGEHEALRDICKQIVQRLAGADDAYSADARVHLLDRLLFGRRGS